MDKFPSMTETQETITIVPPGENNTEKAAGPITAKVCVSWFCKFIGLLGTKSIEKNNGLLFVHTNRIESISIHTWGMTYPIGVVWIDKEMTICEKRLMKPWQMAFPKCKNVLYILEIHPGRMKDFTLGKKVIIK